MKKKIAAAVLAAGWLAWSRRPGDSLQGRSALVTGGSRGLGFLIAHELLREGCRVAICARDTDDLERARRKLSVAGHVLALPCDVADRDAVRALIAELDAHFDGIDILVNNAGIIQVGPLAAMTAADFDRAMAINFGGPLNASLAVLPGMRARGGGRIATIASIGGRVAVPHLLPYDCAKFAAVALSEGLRAELAGTGVRVTTVVPGLMRTGSPPNALLKGDATAEYAWFALGDSTPLTAMSAERAARRIVLAIRRGETIVTLTWQAKVLRLAHDLLPTATIAALGAVARLLPDTDGTGREVRGHQIEERALPRPLLRLVRRPGRRTNQFRHAAG